MGQTGKFPTGLAKGGFSQLCLDSAQTVTAPHGTASVDDGHNGLTVFGMKNFPEPVAQRAGKTAVNLRGCFIHLYVPFLAAAVRTTICDALKMIEIIWLGDQHGVTSKKAAHTIGMRRNVTCWGEWCS